MLKEEVIQARFGLNPLRHIRFAAQSERSAQSGLPEKRFPVRESGRIAIANAAIVRSMRLRAHPGVTQSHGVSASAGISCVSTDTFWWRLGPLLRNQPTETRIVHAVIRHRPAPGITTHRIHRRGSESERDMGELRVVHHEVGAEI